MTLEDAINQAARDLPQGWNVLVDVEQGAGYVRLYDDEGDELDIDRDDCSITEQLITAISIAREGAGLPVITKELHQ